MLITLHPVPRASRSFDDVMRSSLGTATNVNAFDPEIDVIADEQGIRLVCDVPGTRREDMEITIDSGTLTLRGVRRFDSEQGEQVLLGRSYGAFSRSFAIADDVDTERLQAELTDGVLSIHLPTRPRPAPRKIEIATPDEPKRMEG